MTNDETARREPTTQEDEGRAREKLTGRLLGRGKLVLGASVSSVIFAASLGPGCASRSCEETFTCPPPADGGGEDNAMSSGGKLTAGGGGTTSAAGSTASGNGGGGTSSANGGTSGGGGTISGNAGDNGTSAASGDGTIDCGPGNEPDGNGQCVPAAQCRTENDCAGSCRACTDGTCVSVKSADDPDSCAGTCNASGTCKSKRGQACSLSGNGCVAGSTCADGYCCDTECAESCQACDVSGAEGTCTAVTSGNPHGNRRACAGEGTCGGSCSGRSDGKCEYPTSNCGGGSTCSGTDFVGQAKCSDGDCVAPEAKSCDGGFACTGTACKASCGSDADCHAGYFCQNGTCHLDAVDVAVGVSNSAAVLSDGSVYVWGSNGFGLIGPQGPPSTAGEPIQNAPIKLTGLPFGARSVAIGSAYACALLSNDDVWCWGLNPGGGNTNTFNPIPGKITGLPGGVVALAGEASTTCALIGSSGEVYCWGSNYSGLLGTNASGDSPTPVKIAGLSKATQLAVAEHACAIVGAGLSCWGDNSDSECGQPNTTYKIATPVNWLLGSTPQQLGAAADHSCALIGGGDVRCWGQNTYGQLGNPDIAADMIVPQPALVDGLSGVAKISLSAHTNCAIITSGKVRCWGLQAFGALGDGVMDFTSSVAPVEVGGVSNAVSISAGAHSCVLLANGSLKCWGQGQYGELGNSLSSHSGVAVDVTATW
jgi:alpha-tubulin suppressor-like RCC1 family protein